MTTQTIRKERGYLDTRVMTERRATRGSGAARGLLREAAETLWGAFAAPLRAALQAEDTRSLESLDDATRRDIGL